MLVTPDLFFGEINIPNTSQQEVNESLLIEIGFRENECLKDLLGYSLFNAFITNPTEQRFSDLINGKEYSDVNGDLQKWNGLVYTNTSLPANPIIIGYSQKEEVQVQAGTTVGIVVGLNSFVFDGTDGTEDWRGYEITVNRSEYGVMIKNVDYSWDKVTGIFTLLKSGDVFTSNQWFTVNFFPQRIVSYVTDGNIYYFSLIAFYIYFYYMKDKTIWNSGTTTVVPKGNSAINASAALKMENAYNIYFRQARDLANFMISNLDVYPEYSYNIYQKNCSSIRPLNCIDL